MFNYTPKKTILREMIVPKVGAWWDTLFFKKKEILERYGLPLEYRLTSVLEDDFPNVCFYSETPRRQIPVCGFLFPVSMFDEIKVDE